MSEAIKPRGHSELTRRQFIRLTAAGGVMGAAAVTGSLWLNRNDAGTAVQLTWMAADRWRSHARAEACRARSRRCSGDGSPWPPSAAMNSWMV